jgi:hypothetical protein
MKEYKISKGWSIFVYITAPLIIALFGWMVIMLFVTDSENDMITFWIWRSISLGMFLLVVIEILDTIRGKFVIGNDKIFTVSTFSNRQLFFNEIKGYRITGKYIFIESNSEQKKKIVIRTHIEKVNEIEKWLSENYLDLDLVQSNQEKKEILYDQEFWLAAEQREEKAHWIAKILNSVGGWGIFEIGQYRLHVHTSRTKKFYATQPKISKNCSCGNCKYFETVVINQPNSLFDLLKKMKVDLSRQPNINPDGVSCIGDSHKGMLGYMGNYFVFGKIGKTSKRSAQINYNIAVSELTFDNTEFGDHTVVEIIQVDKNILSFEFYMDVDNTMEI